MNTRMLKRVAALERSLPPPPKPDPSGDDEIMRLAELRVSEEDREICWGLLEQQEPLPSGTERENRAVCAYRSAIELECRRAGYQSIEDFEASFFGGDYPWRHT